MPKISLNEWYSGNHWSKRKKIKDNYLWLIKSQFKQVFPKTAEYTVSYEFVFKTRPLDASNAIAMIKLIEDIIFEDDRWDIVREITINSKKGENNFVRIIVNQI